MKNPRPEPQGSPPLPNRIRELRERQHMTQEELAERVGARRQTQVAPGEGDRRRVGIGSDMRDVVDHANPMILPARAACTPCRK